MIRLNPVNSDLISIITAQNGVKVVASYSDASSSGYSGATTATSIGSATTTTVVATPGNGVIRDIDYLNVKNTFAGSHTITIQLSSSATLYPLITVSLLTDESICYTHGSGWTAIDANGNRKEVTSSTFSSVTVTGLTASRPVFTDANKALVSNTMTGTGDVVMSASPTLSGTVTTGAIAAVGSAATSFQAFNASGSTTARVFGTFQNTSGNLTVGAENSTGGQFFGTSSAYDGIVQTASGTNLWLGVGTSGIAKVSSTGLSVTGTLDSTGASTGLVLKTSSTDASGATVHIDTSSTAAAYIGNSTSLIYKAGTQHVHQVSGSTVTTVTSTGLAVTGTLSSTGAISTTLATNGNLLNVISNTNAGASATAGLQLTTNTGSAYIFQGSSAYGSGNNTMFFQGLGPMVFQPTAGATVLNIATTGIAVTGTGTFSGNVTGNGASGFIAQLSGGQQLRMYGSSSGTSHQWDIYLNSTNLRLSDNTGGGTFVVDTAMTVGAGLSVTGSISSTTTLKAGGYTVATLPAGATGLIAYVTDQLTTANAKGVAPTGGGAVVCYQMYNGAAWVGI